MNQQVLQKQNFTPLDAEICQKMGAKMSVSDKPVNLNEEQGHSN